MGSEMGIGDRVWWGVVCGGVACGVWSVVCGGVLWCVVSGLVWSGMVWCVVVSSFEAWGSNVGGTRGETEYHDIVEKACPGAGACGGMYTANTMASAIEAIGMALPFNSSNPALSEAK
mgnify:CR=1 FL=1